MLKVPTQKAKDFWSSFRDFAFKGNMIDLAVGIVIGTGFNNIVKSLVDNIIMPTIGNLIGNVDFSEL
ncbi:large conductance mechanosensitive channel protein MscL, partial [Candidatus Peregrinibacteria bacterium CG_4_10_14_0_2_um_filter_41_8]